MSNGQPSASASKEASWDFLKGSGPSAAAHYHDPLEKPGAFKPGWQSRRPQAAIQQDVQRKGYEAQKEQQTAAFKEIRKERIVEAQGKSGFNPISHQSKGTDGSWGPATDAWQHQKVGIKAQEPRAAAADTLRAQADTSQRNIGITEMRKERIANGGLSKHPGGTMKDVLTWGGQ